MVRRRASAMLHGQLEGTFQQYNRSLYVLIFSQEDAHPPRIGQDVMCLGLPSRNDFIAHGLREGNVHERVSVNVAQFAFAEAKLQSAVAMRSNRSEEHTSELQSHVNL